MIKRANIMINPEALERKARSIEILKQHGVPYIEHLPVIEASSEVTLRDKQAVAKRAACMMFTIQFAIDQLNEYEELDESYELFHGLLTDWGLLDELTDRERLVWSRDADSKALVAIAWRYEAYWVLAWALGLVDLLDYPKDICDVDTATGLISSCKSFDEFVASANMRSMAEILDQDDLIFRYDWACVDARIKKQEAPAGLNPDVVVERHTALNWLIGDTDWEHVSINT